MDPLLTFAGLTNISVPAIIIVAAIFTRISALVFFLPGLGEQTISMRVRLGGAFAVTMVVAPAVFTLGAAPTSPSSIAVMLAAEAVSGALIGFSIRVAIFAIQTAGSIASQSLSLAQLFGTGLDAQMETPISMILTFAAVVLAVSSGLHFQAVSVLILTYEVLPFGMFPGSGETGEWVSERAAISFAVAVSLALPFVALGFLYNMAIGAANRAMPQLMVAFVGVPAVTFAGMALFAMSAPYLLGAWLDFMQRCIAGLMGFSA